MCRYCNVAGENDYKIMFVKRIEGNFCFTMQPSTRLDDALTGASPGLGGGFYFIVRVSFWLCALFKTMMHGYKS